MSYYGGAWRALKFSAGKAYGGATMNMFSSFSFRYLQSKDGVLVYKNNRAYKSVFTHVARQKTMQLIESEVNSLFPKYQRYLEKQMRKKLISQKESNRVQLISSRDDRTKEWGRIIAEGGNVIIAKDKYGNRVQEAMMMYYDAKNAVTVEDVSYTQEKATATTYQTKTVCFIDLAPQVSVQSTKNLVLTTVQGRDHSRKELVSGGDLTFSVFGEIVSDEIDTYPESSVKKFIQIAQYGGVVKVNHFLFSQFNVEQFIIKDYQLGNSEYKNCQPYSFTCVAVEPDTDVSITSDTIAVLNKELAESSTRNWYKLILNNKLTEIAANAASDATSSLANAGLDALVRNI